MGHGDELVLADCNFPSDSIAAQTTDGSLIRLDGNTIPEAADAILSVFPLDSFVENPVLYMQVVGNPDELLEVHTDLKKSVDSFSDRDWPMASLEARGSGQEGEARGSPIKGRVNEKKHPRKKKHCCFFFDTSVIIDSVLSC